MFNLNKKLLISFLIFSILVLSIFTCVFLSHNTFTSLNSHNKSEVGTCCSSAKILATIDHNILVLSDNFDLQFFFLMLSVVFIGNYLRKDRHTLELYFKMRNRYGGFTLFSFLTLLFKQGILHPKSY